MPKAQIKLKPELKVIKEEEIPHLLVPGEMGAVLELAVKDRDGKVTEHRVMRSKSFVRQFLELLYIEFAKVPEKTSMRIVDRTIFEHEGNLDCTGGTGVTDKGIVAGTGTTSPTIDDYQMETLIAHGTAAGELQYSAVTFGAPASDATTSQLTITRDFANASGGTITVNEIGLYALGYDGDAYRSFLIIRDVIAGGIDVPNGQTLTVNYREQAVV